MQSADGGTDSARLGYGARRVPGNVRPHPGLRALALPHRRRPLRHPPALRAPSPRLMASAARVMGIVSVTPDSFWEGGLFLDPREAIRHGHELAAGGASVLDVGGESTRPGAEAVDATEELARVGPVLDGLRDSGVPISIDTSKLAVAQT